MTELEMVAVIFGASGGLGEATVLRVAQDYNVVVGYYRGQSKAQKLVDEITKAGESGPSLLAAQSSQTTHCNDLLRVHEQFLTYPT